MFNDHGGAGCAGFGLGLVNLAALAPLTSQKPVAPLAPAAMAAGSQIQLGLKLSPAQVACMAKGMFWDNTRQTCFIGYASPPPSATSMPGGLIDASAMPKPVPVRTGIKLNFGALTASPQAAMLNIAGILKTTPALASVISGRVLSIAGPGPAMNIIPGASLLSIGFEQHAGLWTVADSASPLFNATLGAMTFTPSAPPPTSSAVMPGSLPSMFGTASFVVGQTSGNALTTVQQNIASGYAALVDKTSLASGVARLAFVSDPNLVAQMAGPTGTYALVSDTDPAPVLAQAAAAVNGGSLPPAVQTVVPATPATPWLTYGLIGAGALALGAIAMSMSGRKATANRARRRGRRH